MIRSALSFTLMVMCIRPERLCISLCLSGMGQQVVQDKQYTGDYNTVWSADDVNTLAELWLGIHRQGQPVQSVQSWLAGYDKNVSVLDTTGKTYYWSNLH
ncbi:hypothetical protein [Enterobacter bugandensis]|uniref:hypothetical protein n=1 Tax=Enterobacter bugandensis TaxID=881260 RepID=UPI0027E50A61|nr:hypothetical protein [Enterobacter bugandensis]